MAATAHLLDIRSTSDISLDSLASVFDGDFCNNEARIDERQIFFKSLDTPSWVQFVASLPWWGQLSAGGAAVVISGYLKEAGASIWKSQPAFAKFMSEKLWLLASKIVTLQQVIPSNTKIKIAFPLQNEHFPAELDLNDLTIDNVAFQIASLCYHQKALETFITSPEFDPATGAWIELLNDGAVTLNWYQNRTLEKRSRTFSI